MELRDLEYFSVVAENSHLGRSAESLGLSQSALSKSLRRLERAMAAKLVKRTPKGVELTAEGAALHARVKRLRLYFDDVRREVSDVRQGFAGRLQITTGAGFAWHMLPVACEKLVREAPDVTANVKIAGANEAISALRNGQAELVLAAMDSLADQDLVQEHLYDEQYTVVASVNHRLARRQRVLLADVAAERWAVQEPTWALRHHWQRVFTSRGLPLPSIAIEANSGILRLSLIANSQLLAYTWDSAAKKAMSYLPLTRLHVKELEAVVPVGIIYRKDSYVSPLAKRFIQILKGVALEMVEER
jgi:DNA-binding transcriptional LysR family regulator